ncbi:DUF6802 family protein [Pseudonocardia parietis]|uniref:DUF6802 domain-containing protein n=1 Tax=Pseudonocardia parietis TaxID=570936 RepID=A0ABS4VMY8_9PSEU|nr:DUF6802 family protein [Pseudonocardia parietis]MBP2364929.1 hypothetical protein [Pseudonocardia parietis]
MRPDPGFTGPVRWPWGVTGVAVAGSAPWWQSVQVPRAPRPEDLLRAGSEVPVSGPAARDADGDGRADTLVVVTPGGTELWSDLDGDGLADRVLVTGPRPDPADGPLAVLPDGER